MHFGFHYTLNRGSKLGDDRSCVTIGWYFCSSVNSVYSSLSYVSIACELACDLRSCWAKHFFILKANHWVPRLGDYRPHATRHPIPPRHLVRLDHPPLPPTIASTTESPLGERPVLLSLLGPLEVIRSRDFFGQPSDCFFQRSPKSQLLQWPVEPTRGNTKVSFMRWYVMYSMVTSR